MNSNDFKQNFINAVLGKLGSNTKYSPEIEQYLATVSPEQRQGVANGLNFGNKDILANQQRLGINIPHGEEQITLARQGQFNLPTEGGVRQGGLINGYNQGYNLNYDNPTNQISTRIGQALGTIKRGADSPLGRAVIAYGAASALNADNPTEQALKAALTRSNNQAANQYYRKQLSDMGFDLSDTNYEINQDIFQNILKGQTLKDNAEFKRMFYDNQQKQNEALMALKQQQLELQKEKERSDNEWRQKELDFKYYDSDNKTNKENKKEGAKTLDAKSTLNQIGLIRKQINKYPEATGLLKGYITGDVLNRIDPNPNNIETRSMIDALRTKIRHDLTGAQFSEKEAREYEKFLPNVRDSKEIINAKLDALEKRYKSDFGTDLEGNPVSSGFKIDRAALEAEINRRKGKK